MITSIIEVLTLCGFIYGAACKLPPSLTILLMNGCVCFPVGHYLICKLRGINYEHAKKKIYSCRYRQGRKPLLDDGSTQTDVSSSKQRLKSILTTTAEILGFIMQLGALVSIPVLLSIGHFYEPSGKAKYRITATYILIPVSLCIISILWSGWIQKLIMRPSGGYKTAKQQNNGSVTAGFKYTTEQSLDDDDDDDCKTAARLKAGIYMAIHALLYVLLKTLLPVCMKYTARGESRMANIA